MTGRRLLRLALPTAGWMALAALLGFATVGAAIGLMATAGFLIATAALQPHISAIQLPVVAVRLFGMGRAGLRYLERYVTHLVTFRLLARVRVWFAERLVPLAPARLSTHKSGDLLGRAVSDVENLEQFYVRALAPPVVAVAVGALTAGLVGAFDLSLAAVVVGLQVLAGFGLPLATRALSRPLSRRLVGLRATLHDRLVDGVQGLPELLVYGQERAFRIRILATADELVALQHRLARITGLHRALTEVAVTAAVLVTLVVGVQAVDGGLWDGVFLGAVVIGVMASFEAVAPLPAALTHLDTSLASAERVFALSDAEPEVPPGGQPPPEGHALVLRDVWLRYRDDDRPALRGVDLEVPAGSTVAVVGPSGSGKTSLLALLLRFWDWERGSIEVGGHDLRALDADGVRTRMAVVGQGAALFGGTVRDNLLLARPEATAEQLEAALRQAGLDLADLPDGWDTWIGEHGVQLSGGERQRLALARALLVDAPILLLDEPTAHLDALTEQEVLASLRRAMAGRTTVLVTHRLIGLDHVDQIVVLRRGEVVQQGTWAQLVATPGPFQRMWSLQRQSDALRGG